MNSPREIQHKYEGQGPVDYLLGATEFAMQNLKGISISAADLFKKDKTGDLVTAMDRSVHRSVIEYFQARGIPIAFLGEEGQSQVTNPRWAILADEIEGTQNAVNALTYGINLGIAPYKPRLRVSDLEAAVVTNLSDGRVFVGEKGKGAYKIQDAQRRELDRKQTDVYECPSPFAYTTDFHQVEYQKILAEVFRDNLGNQPRSVDATGTRLVELVDGNIRAHGDYRFATKCWDVLPSRLIIQEAGFVLTDVFGFDLSEAIFYDKDNPNFNGDGGLNRKVGNNFIAANPEDHEKLVFGIGKNILPQHPCAAAPPKLLSVHDHIRINEYRNLGWFEALGDKKINREEFWRGFGKRKADSLNASIKLARQDYVELNLDNVQRIIEKTRDRYVDILFGGWAEEAQGLHLKAFDETINPNIAA